MIPQNMPTFQDACRGSANLHAVNTYIDKGLNKNSKNGSFVTVLNRLSDNQSVVDYVNYKNQDVKLVDRICQFFVSLFNSQNQSDVETCLKELKIFAFNTKEKKALKECEKEFTNFYVSNDIKGDAQHIKYESKFFLYFFQAAHSEKMVALNKDEKVHAHWLAMNS